MDCADRRVSTRRPRKEFDEAKRTEIFKQIESILNKAVHHTSLWTTNALSAKNKTPRRRPRSRQTLASGS